MFVHIEKKCVRFTSVGLGSYLIVLLGAQWLSGRVHDSRQGAAGSSLTGVTMLCPWPRHIYPCLVLVQARKTRPGITEKLLTGT